jgi:hypothetical protein
MKERQPQKMQRGLAKKTSDEKRGNRKKQKGAHQKDL